MRRVNGFAGLTAALNEGEANAWMIQKDAYEFATRIARAANDTDINVGVDADMNVGVDADMNVGVDSDIDLVLVKGVYDFHSWPGFMR